MEEAENALVKQITEICLGLLTIREHSQQELLQKLAAKGFCADLVQPVLNTLALQDWQSDHRYATAYARHRLQKGYGALRIAYELRLRGVTGFDLDGVLAEVGENWMGLLRQTYLRKYSADSPISRLEWAKRSRFLLQRGFSADMIKRLFKHLHLKFE